MKASKIVAVFVAALFFFGCARYNFNLFPKHKNPDGLNLFEWEKKSQTQSNPPVVTAENPNNSVENSP